MSPEHSDSEQICFFICALGESNSRERDWADQVMEYIVKPAAEENGLTAIRCDKGPPGMITEQIIHHIMYDRIVVADLSGLNANVFYELGVRHAFHKPVVQMIRYGQELPFDVERTRTVFYNLDLKAGGKARAEVSEQLAAALRPSFVVQSPVTATAELKNLARRAGPGQVALMKTILERLDQVDRAVSDVAHRVLPSEKLNEALSPFIQDQVGGLVRSYAEEISLLRSVRQAGVTGIFKRRETAIRAFAPAIDEETQEIMVVGSSLKGLFQKEEYKDIAEKIRFKASAGSVKVRFLLTHPAVADFRARQEYRRQKDIGQEVIRSLETLKGWPRERCEVKLYLGTPTCFAIKTTRTMLINPYPYVSVSYDSPCLILEYSSGGEAESYFFDEFKSRHFGAWDTELSVPVEDFDEAISRYRGQLDDYAKTVEDILSSDPAVRAQGC